jgi:hypothetical protein
MSNWNFKKVPAPTAAKVCEDIELEEAATQLLTADITPADFLELLIKSNSYVDAAKFLARALPPREATWWACLCARTSVQEETPAESRQALKLAEKWVFKPTEENRRLTFDAAQKTDFKSPASWAAMAAFWSGGSLAPPELPVVPPAANLTGKAVTGAVMLAALVPDPVQAPEKYRHFFDLGVDLACGGKGQLKPA